LQKGDVFFFGTKCLLCFFDFLPLGLLEIPSRKSFLPFSADTPFKPKLGWWVIDLSPNFFNTSATGISAVTLAFSEVTTKKGRRNIENKKYKYFMV